MIVKITFNQNDVVETGNGYIMLKVDFYSYWKSICSLISMSKAYTAEEVNKAPITRAKHMVINQRGTFKEDRGV